jgi:hypothetical protein
MKTKNVNYDYLTTYMEDAILSKLTSEFNEKFREEVENSDKNFNIDVVILGDKVIMRVQHVGVMGGWIDTLSNGTINKHNIDEILRKMAEDIHIEVRDVIAHEFDYS